MGFPSGSVVKNPPCNAGDTGSIPGPRRSHMLERWETGEEETSSAKTFHRELTS